MVPGAVAEVFIWTPPSLSAVRGSGTGSGISPAVVGTGTFIYPVSSRNFTQRYWYGHPGVDIALSEGSGVFASDTGTVTFAGWNIYGYGNLIVVNHGNGYETFYGHLSGINVFPGQVVNQGNVIGAVGNTGNSSGPHIHFEIRTGGQSGRSLLVYWLLIRAGDGAAESVSAQALAADVSVAELTTPGLNIDSAPHAHRTGYPKRRQFVLKRLDALARRGPAGITFCRIERDQVHMAQLAAPEACPAPGPVRAYRFHTESTPIQKSGVYRSFQCSSHRRPLDRRAASDWRRESSRIRSSSVAACSDTASPT